MFIDVPTFLVVLCKVKKKRESIFNRFNIAEQAPTLMSPLFKFKIMYARVFNSVFR